jgi:hypothetical protein
MRPDKTPESESRDIGVNWCILADNSHGVVFLFLLELYKSVVKREERRATVIIRIQVREEASETSAEERFIHIICHKAPLSFDKISI